MSLLFILEIWKLEKSKDNWHTFSPLLKVWVIFMDSYFFVFEFFSGLKWHMSFFEIELGKLKMLTFI